MGVHAIVCLPQDKINETAAPQDKVDGEALAQRVRYEAGQKCQSDTIEQKENSHNERIENEKEVIFTDAKRWATVAITNLQRIKEDDLNRVGQVLGN